MRKLEEKKIIIATSHSWKTKEIAEMLKPYGFEILTSDELGFKAPKPEGKDIRQIARNTALFYAKEAGIPTIAEESGLYIHSMDNEPGRIGSDFAPNVEAGIRKINEALKDAQDKSAHLHSAVTIAWPDGHTEEFEGKTHGTMVHIPQGEGLAYDVIFAPYGFSMTFAQMDPEQKASLSHRGKAIKQLISEVLL